MASPRLQASPSSRDSLPPENLLYSEHQTGQSETSEAACIIEISEHMAYLSVSTRQDLWGQETAICTLPPIFKKTFFFRVILLLFLVAKFCPTLSNPMDCSPQFLCPWTIPGKKSGVGCHFLLQGIFKTQGSKPAVPTLTGRFFTAKPPGKPQQN